MKKYADVIQRDVELVYDNGVASKILQHMDRVRNNKSDVSARRWVWELIQNAKDVTYDDGVDIKISISDEELIFSHTGKPFTIKNVLSIINQISSKTDDSSTTGMFGTGFVTTHQLSEVVQLEGIVSNDDLPLKRFNVPLDRSGEDMTTITDSVKNSLAIIREIDNNETVESEDHDFNTKLIYKLNDQFAVDIARKGVDDLCFNIGYVLASIPKINSIIVVDTMGGKDDTITYEVIGRRTVGSLEVVDIDLPSGTENICISDKDGMQVMFPMKDNDLLSIDKNTSKLLIDFPLIGSEGFALPYIVSSHDFHPNEERSFTPVSVNNATQSNENKVLFEKSVDIFLDALVTLISNGYTGFHNIAKLREIELRPDLDKEWFRISVLKPVLASFLSLKLFDGRSLDEGLCVVISDSKDELCAVHSIVSKLPDYTLISEDMCLSWSEMFTLIRKEYSDIVDIPYIDLDKFVDRRNEWLTLNLQEGYDRVQFLSDCYTLVKSNIDKFREVKEKKWEIIPNYSLDKLLSVEGSRLPINLDDFIIDLAYDCDDYICSEPGFRKQGYRNLYHPTISFYKIGLDNFLVHKDFVVQDDDDISKLSKKYIMDRVYKVAGEVFNLDLVDGVPHKLLKSIINYHKEIFNVEDLNKVLEFSDVYIEGALSFVQYDTITDEFSFLDTNKLKPMISILLKHVLSNLIDKGASNTDDVDKLNFLFTYANICSFDYREFKCFLTVGYEFKFLRDIVKYSKECIPLLEIVRYLKGVDDEAVDLLENALHFGLEEHYISKETSVSEVGLVVNRTLGVLLRQEGELMEQPEDYQYACSAVLEWIKHNPDLVGRCLPEFANSESQARLLTPIAVNRIQEERESFRNTLHEVSESTSFYSVCNIMEDAGFEMSEHRKQVAKRIDQESKLLETDGVRIDYTDEFFHSLSEEDQVDYVHRVGLVGHSLAYKELKMRFGKDYNLVEEEKFVAKYQTSVGYVLVHDCDTKYKKQEGYDLRVDYYENDELVRTVKYEVKSTTSKEKDNIVVLTPSQYRDAVIGGEDFYIIGVWLVSELLDRSKPFLFINDVINDSVSPNGKLYPANNGFGFGFR